jgi:NitT/TauT family transport system permease protein
MSSRRSAQVRPSISEASVEIDTLVGMSDQATKLLTWFRVGLRLAGVLVVGLVVWQLSTGIGNHLLPGPVPVFEAAVNEIADGSLFVNAWASCYRVLIGFALGSLLAIPIGFLMGWYSLPRSLIEPYIHFFRMIPPLALIPLCIVLLGIGEATKVFVIFLAVFLSCVVATYQGVLDVDRTLINGARVLGAKDGTIFLRVVVPAATPYILVGMRIGLGAAWSTVVAAELIAAQHGLGRMMLQAQLYFDLPTIFVGLLTIGILGLSMDGIFVAIQRRLTRWQERR